MKQSGESVIVFIYNLYSFFTIYLRLIKITIPPFLTEELKEYCSHLYGIMSNERMFRFTKSYMEHEIVRGIKETGVI